MDDQGDIIVAATEAPSDEVHFTKQAQFLVGEMICFVLRAVKAFRALPDHPFRLVLWGTNYLELVWHIFAVLRGYIVIRT